MKRFKMGKANSRRNFTKNAVKLNRRNMASPMRGGIRL